MDRTGSPGPNDGLDGVAGTQSSRRLSRSAEPRPTEIQTIAAPGAAISGRLSLQAPADHTSQYGVESDAQSRTFQVTEVSPILA